MNKWFLFADLMLLLILAAVGYVVYGWEGAQILCGIYIVGQGFGLIINAFVPLKSEKYAQ